MKINVLKKDEIYKINNLISEYKFHDYNAYRMINKDKLREYLFNQISNLSKDKNSQVVLAAESNGPVGLASLTYLPWDTKNFGFKMGKIGYLLGKGNYHSNIRIKNKLLNFIFSLCKEEKFVHLSCRIDVRDITSAHILEENGFKIMDTLVTYVFSRVKNSIPKIKDLYKVRKFKDKDLGKLLALANSSFRQDRFHMDFHFPLNKADALYGEWVKNYCYGKKGETVLVAENKNTEAVGFLAYKLSEDLTKLGYRVFGEGLSAVSPKAKGAYLSLVKASIKDVLSFADYGEFDTQIQNYEVIKIFQKFDFKIVRTKHTFHKWLGQRVGSEID